MFSELFSQLKETHEAMMSALAALLTSIDNEDLPCTLVRPNTTGRTNKALILEALQNIEKRSVEEKHAKVELDRLTQSGLLCLSPTTTARLIELNQAKVQFKASVQALRVYGKDKVTSFDRLLERIHKKEPVKNNALENAMRNLNLGRLDLAKCYTQLRLLPEHVDSVSFTWSKKHTEIREVTFEKALAMANALPDTTPDAKIFALSRLAGLRPGTRLAHKHNKRPQLYCNVVHFKEDQRLRHAYTVSGILFQCNDTLPRKFIWRELNENEERLPRSDQQISEDPYIACLGLYLYVK